MPFIVGTVCMINACAISHARDAGAELRGSESNDASTDGSADAAERRGLGEACVPDFSTRTGVAYQAWVSQWGPHPQCATGICIVYQLGNADRTPVNPLHVCSTDHPTADCALPRGTCTMESCPPNSLD